MTVAIIPIESEQENVRATDIVKIVAGFCGVTSAGLIGYSRARKYTVPRQVAMYLVRKHCGYSYPQVGSIFRRDHTTVMYACRQIEKELEKRGEE